MSPEWIASADPNEPMGTPTASGKAGPAPEPVPPRKRPFAMHGRLYLGLDIQGMGWSIADPADELAGEAYGSLYHQVFSGFSNPQPEVLTVNRRELQRVLSLAEAWMFLGTYELGTACVVEKLRQVRAALRAGTAHDEPSSFWALGCHT